MEAFNLQTETLRKMLGLQYGLLWLYLTRNNCTLNKNSTRVTLAIRSMFNEVSCKKYKLISSSDYSMCKKQKDTKYCVHHVIGN